MNHPVRVKEENKLIQITAEINNGHSSHRSIDMTDTAHRLGVVIFPGFALLDIAGPLQFFNQLSAVKPFELSIIAKSMEPVSTTPPEHVSSENKCRPIGERWLPTHTFDTAPELDILLIPGGFGARDQTIFDDVGTFVEQRYPNVKYLLTVCTGAAIVAGTGILDGRRATSNKASWTFSTRFTAVQWVPKARWVVDGNIWSSSGVAAGMDMTFAFIASVFSLEIAQRLANVMEYEPHTNPDWDPFADIWQVSS